MKAPLRILVVDDDEAVIEFLTEFLRETGFVVSATSDPDAAVKLAQSQRFDVALVDMRLPGNSGANIVRQVRQAQPETPCVVMTGFALEDEVQAAFEAGACEALSKPFENLMDLVRVLKEAA